MTDSTPRAIALSVCLLMLAGSAIAAPAADFYSTLLTRGVANYEAGRYEAAVRELDVASFGLIDSVNLYETAKVYTALANDKLGREAEARLAAQRVVAGERVQRRFGQLTLPGEVRTAFLALARRMLSAPEVAALTTNAPVPTPPPSGPRTEMVATASQPTHPKIDPKPQQPAQVVPVPPTTTPATQQKPPAGSNATVPAPAKAQSKIEERVVSFPEPAKAQTTDQPKAQAQRPEPAKPAPAKAEPPRIEPVRPPEPSTTAEASQRRPAPAGQPATAQKPAIVADPLQATATPKTAEPPKNEPTPQASAKRAPAVPQARRNVPAALADAEKLIDQQRLNEARDIYRNVLETQLLDHESLLGVAEGAYRCRDFSTAVLAFERLGTLPKGEEAYRYYFAVALYESGRYREAKRELAAALPFIEISPSVARYRAKIEGSID